MSSPDSTSPSDPRATAAPQLAEAAPRILALAEQVLADDALGELPDEAVQQLLLAAVRLFSAKRDQGDRLEAFPAGTVTATDVAVTAVAMTEVVNLELFELAMWHGWSNI
jgi:hypothetical protein